MYRIGVDGFGEVRTNSTGRRLLWVGGTHQLAIFGNGALTFQHLHNNRTRGHETYQVFKERAFAMFSIKTTSHIIGQTQHFRGNDLQAGLLKARVNLANNILGNCVRFDDRERAFNSHGNLQIKSGATAGLRRFQGRAVYGFPPLLSQ